MELILDGDVIRPKVYAPPFDPAKAAKRRAKVSHYSFTKISCVKFHLLIGASERSDCQ